MYRKWIFTLVLTCLLPFGAAGQWHTSNQSHFDNALQFLPLAMELGLGFCTPHQQTFTDRFLVAATGYLVMGTTVFTLKTFTASPRPDSDATNSFPSGHTATAFLGAELVRLEYGTGWAIGAYSIATLTAVMRVYHDRHRIEDTLAGAGIGILSAHIAHRLLPVWKELLNLEGTPLQVSALPCCMPTQEGAVAGLALSVRF